MCVCVCVSLIADKWPVITFAKMLTVFQLTRTLALRANFVPTICIVMEIRTDVYKMLTEELKTLLFYKW